jgi:hypothetical protein
MIENEELMDESLVSLREIINASKKLKEAIVTINNRVYIPNVARLRDLVIEKEDYNLFTKEEKRLLENNMLVVRILYKLTNTSLYKVTETDEKGEPTKVESNAKEAISTVDIALTEVKKIIN